MRSPVPGLLALLLVLAVAGLSSGLAVASAGHAQSVAPATTPVAGDAAVASTPPNFTRPDPPIVVRINLTPGGDAHWRVASRFNVSNESEAAAFRAFADTVTDGGANARIGYSEESFRRFTDVVEETTNRSGPMDIRNATWQTGVENGTGTLALSFTWTNFARVDGTHVVLDDVFGGEDATWFQELSEGQRLVINAPPGYGVESSRFPVDESTIVLDGPRDLDTADTPIVYVPVNTDTPPSSSTTDPEQNVSPIVLGGGFFAVVLAVVAGFYLYSRRKGPAEDPGVTADPEATPSGTTDGGETTTGTVADEPVGRPDETAGDSAGDAAGVDEPVVAGPGEESDEEDDLDEIDEELLSDEERVERLLKKNGGRMKQANIVTETGWSNAKVSQLLSAMDEDDRIDKLRIGRENLITLPDEDVGEID